MLQPVVDDPESLAVGLAGAERAEPAGHPGIALAVDVQLGRKLLGDPGHRVADRTESRTIAQLANFPAQKSPPLVYITGQRNLVISDRETDILREYLLDKHGMLFADNGGSGGWHGQFFDVMRRVLPTVRPVRVPLDHPVHRLPYSLPFLPYVAPHGGKDAWGWVVDGRLVCYYHPGDIGDAWADGHAGVKRPIWEACYQFGTNIIFYAHARYNRWLDTQSDNAQEAN